MYPVRLNYRQLFGMLGMVAVAALANPDVAKAQTTYDDTYDSVGSGGYNDGGYDTDVYRPAPTPYDPNQPAAAGTDPYASDGYSTDGYGSDADAYAAPAGQPATGADDYGGPTYGEPYSQPAGQVATGRKPRPTYPSTTNADPNAYGEPIPGSGQADQDRTYSSREIAEAGHRFFGSITAGLAEAIEFAFQRAGRPNGYILGEEGGGAFVAGVRYGEGTLYTKNAGTHPVYWQGPTIGYDFGAEGSKTITLVYNLYDPSEIYNVYGGIDGSAYLVGGVGLTFQKHEHVTLAPIRSGVGLRLGANVGYLRYTREPRILPF